MGRDRKNGLFIFNKKNSINLNKKEGLLSNQINIIYKDKKRIFGLEPIEVYVLLMVINYTKIYEIKESFGQYINILYENVENMWIGTQKGLYYLNNKVFSKFKQVYNQIILMFYHFL